MASLDGRVAVVTASAGAGIGQATVRTLAALGAKVVVSDIARAEKRVREVVEDLRGRGREAEGLVCDVTDPAQVDALVAGTLRRFGRLDIFVNNAGWNQLGPVTEIPDDVADRILAVNLHGPAYATRAALPAMVKQRWGRVVLISSIAAFIGAANGQACYSAAKAGLLGFARNVAREVAAHGVTVNSVSPSIVMNPFLLKQYDEAYLKARVAEVPAGRAGRPEDIANAVAFLASPEADYITGETLCVSGGSVMR
ncbi:MAG: SDR family NAD(P)-dependent oxidoreductase [Halobacteria archaeon]